MLKFIDSFKNHIFKMGSIISTAEKKTVYTPSEILCETAGSGIEKYNYINDVLNLSLPGIGNISEYAIMHRQIFISAWLRITFIEPSNINNNDIKNNLARVDFRPNGYVRLVTQGESLKYMLYAYVGIKNFLYAVDNDQFNTNFTVLYGETNKHLARLATKIGFKAYRDNEFYDFGQQKDTDQKYIFYVKASLDDLRKGIEKIEKSPALRRILTNNGALSILDK